MKPGLGRGLGALINPKAQEEINRPVDINKDNIQKDDGSVNEVLVKIEVEKVVPNPYQPRVEFDPKSLNELKHSILQNGLVQPITVRRGKEGKYELISGERRLRACKDIGYKTIPAYIIHIQSKEAMLALALIENIQREELNAIEVALAYQKLIQECNLSQEQVSERVGKDRSTIANSLRLLKLPEEIQNSLIKNEISAGHARALINLYDENAQLSLLQKIKKDNLSVRKVEQLAKSFVKEKQNGAIVHPKSKEHSSDLVSQKDIESKLRNVFGTKVTCRQKKDGAGQITIDFYSNDELERLFDLFAIIENNNS
ncbi:MAG: DNA-binding protein [Ignavibacteriae bacterium]|nr:MAG: DNA-binding protein [Ignavibacteriota bacterium]